MGEAARVLRAYGEWIYVQKIVEERTSGGLFIPQTADYRHKPRLRFASVENTFRARVLSIGPRVDLDIDQGDEILVYTFAEGDGSKFYTGENVGEKGRLFIKPKDIVCAISR